MMKALKLKDAVIGINNRNLKTFVTDIRTTQRLTALIPSDRLVVSESGIKSIEDMQRLEKSGANAFLVGETLMRKGQEAFVKKFTGAPAGPSIKICGLTRKSDIQIANTLQIDYAGFVFAKSKRQVSVEEARQLIAQLDTGVRSVGVFVDRLKEDVERIAQVCGLDIIQLHGSEAVEAYVLDRPVWKSVAVRDNAEIQVPDEVNLTGLVFDTFSEKQAGGTGKTFAWTKSLPETEKFRIAAGGLNKENVEKCIAVLQPDILDISSGVESLGVKDPEKMRTFVETVRQPREAN
jgi:phosphoribosylanthranilate isomerase